MIQNCVKINHAKSDFTNIVFGVPQGSIVAPILLNIFSNEVFFCLYIASPHNFTDDDTLSSSVKTTDSLAKVLESESNCAIEWFDENKTIVNSDKLQAILLD